MAICFAANIAFITLELSLVALEWVFVVAGKLVSGLGATLSTAVRALVTLVWAFAAVGSTAVLAIVTLVRAFARVGRPRFESLTFENRSRSRSTIFTMTPYDGRCQNLQTSFFALLIFAKV